MYQNRKGMTRPAIRHAKLPELLCATPIGDALAWSSRFFQQIERVRRLGIQGGDLKQCRNHGGQEHGPANRHGHGCFPSRPTTPGLGEKFTLQPVAIANALSARSYLSFSWSASAPGPSYVRTI